jgi:hypothetical protein
MNIVVCTVITGLGATALVDLWSIARKRLLAVPAPDYGLVGRWIGHMPRGRFRHASISAATPIAGEAAIGWTSHYLIGIAFAALLPALWGADWFRNPGIAPALIVGIATVAAPFLLMQPGMGAGIAANRTARPATARLHSLVTHAIFGVGLFASGWVISHFQTP